MYPRSHNAFPSPHRKEHGLVEQALAFGTLCYIGLQTTVTNSTLYQRVANCDYSTATVRYVGLPGSLTSHVSSLWKQLSVPHSPCTFSGLGVASSMTSGSYRSDCFNFFTYFFSNCTSLWSAPGFSVGTDSVLTLHSTSR